MGVTNLEKKQEETHTKDAALFAIDLVNEASKILIDEDDPSKGCVNVRVGFHCGSVVSNVIGSLNPRYGLFGDTVNTSNKMESNSKANRILCSEAAFKLLAEQAPEISVRKRGRISVKGKGEMVVYWVGDHEIHATNDQGKSLTPVVTEGENRRVDFVEHDEEVVDEQPSRRELKNKALPEMAPAHKSKTALRGAPSIKKKPARKSVKEAIHMKRSKY